MGAGVFGDDLGMVELSKADRGAYARSMLRRRWVLGLEREGVATVGELRALSEQQLREFWGVGPKIIADIFMALEDPVLRPEDPLGAWRCRPRLRSPSATRS